MVDEERLLELLAEWDARRRQGQEPSPETLCPEEPEVQQALRLRIQKRHRIEAALDASTVPASDGQTAPLPQLANYDILEVLGHGGMGVVYKARQRSLDRLVALKMILAGPLGSREERARIRTEAEAVARLQHDNIVRIYEIGEQAGHAYLALELVNGGTLDDFLNGQPVPPRQAAELTATLARAVHHAHEHGIIHRDLKPANVLLQLEEGSGARDSSRSLSGARPQAILKVADFGLAKRMDSAVKHTQTGYVLGTPSYMAPEQAEGRPDIGPGVDIHALGAILYELLTGRPPFRGANMLETLEQVRAHDAVSPRLLQPMVPRDLEVICLKCLQKLPRDRYESASQLADDLQAYLDGEPIRARDFSLMSQVARAVEHTSFSENFGRWGEVTLALAPAPLLVTLAVYALAWSKPSFPLIICNATAITMFLVQVFLLQGNRVHMGLVPSRERRHIVTIWLGHALAGMLLWFIVWYATPKEHPEQYLLIFPCWMILLAMANLGLAAERGMSYVIALVCLLLGVITVFIPYGAPLLLGTFGTMNMTYQGLSLRALKLQCEARARQGQEQI